MTKAKADLPMPVRTPAYVSREVGAAELCISPETWDDWVRGGHLPKAVYINGSPRWRWQDVDITISGRGAVGLASQADPYMPGAKHGQGPQRGRRAAS